MPPKRKFLTICPQPDNVLFTTKTLKSPQMLWKFSHYNYSCNSIGFGKYVLHKTAKCETSIVFIWSIRRFLHLLNITSWAEYGYFSSVDFEISDLGPSRLYFEAGLGSISNMPSDDKMPPSLGVTRFRVVQLLQNLTEAPANFDSDDNTMRHRYDTTNFLKQKSTHNKHYIARQLYYNDVIMGAMASQITSVTIVYSNVYSGADQRKHQSSASLAFVRGIHRGPVNSPHKGPVTRKIFPFDDVIM